MNSNSNSFIRVQVRVRVQKKYFFEFKFEFGKMIEFFRLQVRVRSPVWHAELLCSNLWNFQIYCDSKKIGFNWFSAGFLKLSSNKVLNLVE